ncbi:MAG: helix-hairpin-helix domain-containing protein, partial [Dehalococcoidia bacterium]|nr:helix-hairpin-helix domain-containing protein [Dehalococcoidia bacterium]
QVGRDVRRSAFQPEELARLFMELHAKRLVQGLFLSSGIAGNASSTMERMIKTVDILRRRYEFKGYVHLKMLPGATFDCVEAACKLANRVSVNMEAPTAHHLAKLSSRKDIYDGILEPMRWVKRLTAANEKLAPAGQTTQFVVGAAGETDQDILHTTAGLYREIGLRRVYFSAYYSVGDPRLEAVRPAPPMREHRLYEADWLLRVYRFSPQEVELALGKNGHLSLKNDPKLSIAQRQPWLYPVDVNRATYDQLLRVPGIGPTSANRILEARKEHSITSLEQLKKMRVVTRRAGRFIWLPGMTSLGKQTSFMDQVDDQEASGIPALAEALG